VEGAGGGLGDVPAGVVFEEVVVAAEAVVQALMAQVRQTSGTD